MNMARNRIVSLALAVCLLLGMTLAVPGPVEVSAADVEIQQGLPSITVGDTSVSDRDDVTVIGFGGKEWYVIGDETSGVSTGDSEQITLLLKSGAEYAQTGGYELTYYDNVTSSHNYSGSVLENAMNNAYSSLSNKEQGLVIHRDFVGGATYNDNSDKVAGNALNGAGFWPLSVREANLVSQSVRALADTNTSWAMYYWWLRSPGGSALLAANVDGSGSVDSAGYSVGNSEIALRPAFQLNLASVIFTSDASGASKSGVAGSSLSAAEPPTGAIKFTMQDKGQSLEVTATKIRQDNRIRH